MDMTDAAVTAAVKLSDRYITGRFLPDKAIDIMDEAGARARIKAMKMELEDERLRRREAERRAAGARGMPPDKWEMYIPSELGCGDGGSSL